MYTNGLIAPHIAAIPGPPPAADGPTLGMASVKAEKWTRKDEADHAVSLTLRLGFRGELNNGSSLQLHTQYPLAGSRV